jgi:hypothetical protein
MLDIRSTGGGQLAGLSKIHNAVVDLSSAKSFPERAGDLSHLSDGRSIPMIGLFEHFKFVGGAELTFANWRYVGDWWFNKISSIIIITGVWEFFSAKDYQGDCWILGPGLYDKVTVQILSIRSHS